jgi:hypothetical protein
MRRKKLGTVTRIHEGELSPGVEFRGDRTVLDAARVIVRLGGEEVSLAELLRGLPAPKADAALEPGGPPPAP